MEKIKGRTLIVVFILFVAVGISRAEPTPTVSYLMNTPVSMLDFGIYKLEKYLDYWGSTLKIAGIEPIIEVTYLYSSNRIIIKMEYYLLKEHSKEIENIKNKNMKTEMTRVIKLLKGVSLALDFETGKPTQGCCSSIDRFFSHQGYLKKDEPKNLKKELDQITEIHVGFWNVKEWFKCKSPLLGNKIYWEK